MCEDPAEAYPSYTYQDTAFFLCLEPAGLQPDGYQRPGDTGDQPQAKRIKSEPIDVGDAPPGTFRGIRGAARTGCPRQ